MELSLTFTDQNVRSLEINLTLLINKQITCSPSLAMRRYSVQSKARKQVNGYWFLSSARNLPNKHGKQLLDIDAKAGLDLIKSASKIVVHKAAEKTGEFIGNKIAEKIVKPKSVSDENLRNIEEMIIPPQKRKEILNKLRQVL